MKFPILMAVIFIAILTSCTAAASQVETASIEYKQYINYESLQKIHDKLFVGMNQSEVVRLLGEPDYSPIEGQYYYSTDRYEYSEEQDREVTVALVVDYRKEDGKITEKLHDFWLGKISE